MRQSPHREDIKRTLRSSLHCQFVSTQPSHRSLAPQTKALLGQQQLGWEEPEAQSLGRRHRCSTPYCLPLRHPQASPALSAGRVPPSAAATLHTLSHFFSLSHDHLRSPTWNSHPCAEPRLVRLAASSRYHRRPCLTATTRSRRAGEPQAASRCAGMYADQSLRPGQRTADDTIHNNVRRTTCVFLTHQVVHLSMQLAGEGKH